MNCVDLEEKPRKSQTFYAKSSNEHHDRITVKEHIEKVSSLAGTFGEEIGMPNAARIAGLFHDFGKYSPAFQRILDGTMQNVDHAFAGAVILYLLKAQKSEILRKKYSPILEAVQGHHHGLVSMDALVDSLMETFQSQDADCCPSGKLPSLRGADAFSAALLAFRADFSGFSFPKIENRKVLSSDSVADMLDTRMLFTYMLLTSQIQSAMETVGLDPAAGYLHTLRPGRPSFALDLIEELRAPLCDRFVISLFNKGQLSASDFEKTKKPST